MKIFITLIIFLLFVSCVNRTNMNIFTTDLDRLGNIQPANDSISYLIPKKDARKFWLDNKLYNIHKCKPCKIQGYDGYVKYSFYFVNKRDYTSLNLHLHEIKRPDSIVFSEPNARIWEIKTYRNLDTIDIISNYSPNGMTVVKLYKRNKGAKAPF